MSKYDVKVCDVCKKKYASNVRRHWSDCVGNVVLSFKDHAGVQLVISKDMCTPCASTLRDVITTTIKSMEIEEETK